LRWLVLLVVAVAVVLGAVVCVPLVGLWLVVADPLEHADAIFVLDGGTPAREVEAAALYHRGLAPLVAVSNPRDPQDVARRLARQLSPQDIAALALRNLGVPEAALLRLTPSVANTAQELRVIADFAAVRKFRRVIIVTSPSHTRRARIIWDARHAGLAAVIRPTPYETFDARRWWRSRRSAEHVAHELFGILNFRLGETLPTFDDGR
jgi:uncharacterized SAM-binding protein YcdF (DUF218 family)